MYKTFFKESSCLNSYDIHKVFDVLSSFALEKCPLIGSAKTETTKIQTKITDLSSFEARKKNRGGGPGKSHFLAKSLKKSSKLTHTMIYQII